MRKVILVLFISIFSSNTKAQWVNIPDSNFVSFLTQHFPVCMNGNQMDTTCYIVRTLVNVNCANSLISNLDGIQYFDSLRDLNCGNNNLSYLPSLPSTVIRLQFNNNNFSNWPDLPPNLEYLYCTNNQLVSPVYFPASLTEIYVGGNQISSLPALPPSLEVLSCGSNLLSALPVLPSTLTAINCGDNQINILPTLPTTLTVLQCYTNPLTSIPVLPDSLQNLTCGFCLLTQLPLLPNSVEYLFCQDNQLTSLPTLPSNLSVLDCSENPLASLPMLPLGLDDLTCNSTLLSSLPTLPDILDLLSIENNPNLYCLPRLKTINYFYFRSTGIQCLPNTGNIGTSNPPITSFPICDPLNANNCDLYWNLGGTCYQDLDSDCVLDSNEILLKNIKVDLYSSNSLIQNAFTDVTGLYIFEAGPGTYEYNVDTTDLPFIINCPTQFSYNSVLTSIDTLFAGMDFGVECKAGFDLKVNSIVNSVPLFPGTDCHFNIGAGELSSHYGLNCSNSIAGSVEVQFQGPISYISPATGALTPIVSGNTLTYVISDFGSINFDSDFNFIVNVNTTATVLDTVCINVVILPLTGDRIPGNNLLQQCFNIVNSFDPNEKEVYPSGYILPDQEWLTYTIHFQNTGNAPAHNIFILDTVDANLDLTTFTVLSYSHENYSQVIGNVARFNFSNIYLPDSTNDEPNSHGYIQYKAKPMNGLSIGTDISNTANIYFDFNPPIRTNTTVNTVSNFVSVTKIQSDINFSVYPNPVNEEARLVIDLHKPSRIKVEIYNSLGANVKTISEMSYNLGSNEIVISTSGLSQGIYQLRLTREGEMETKKIVKM